MAIRSRDNFDVARAGIAHDLPHPRALLPRHP
jgi:hypothetical protein